MPRSLKIGIENPCSENWDNMMPDATGRFCLSCTKQVVDFSKMTDQDLVRFFKNYKGGEICGQLAPHQVNRELVSAPRKKSFLPYFLRVTIPAMLLMHKGMAQQPVTPGSQYEVNEAVKSDRNRPAHAVSPVLIRGQVIDHEGSPVPYASVSITGTGQYSLADSTGEFQLHYKGAADSIQLSCTALSFEDAGITLVADQLLRPVEIRLQPRLLEPVIVKSDIGYVKGGMRIGALSSTSGGMIIYQSKGVIDTLQNWVKEVVFKFRIYPNPARASAPLNVHVPDGFEGDVVCRILSLEGRVLQTTRQSVSKGSTRMQVMIPRLAAGTYVVQLGEVRTGKWASEKVLIQQ